MIKRLVVSLAAVGALSMAIPDGAEARSVSASIGGARIGANANCFNSSFATGAVTSTCATDYVAALTVDVAGNKQLFFTSRATAAGASCRAVSNNRFGTAFVASPFVPIPVNAAYILQATAAVPVPGAGVFIADCIMNNGASVNQLDYAP